MIDSRIISNFSATDITGEPDCMALGIHGVNSRFDYAENEAQLIYSILCFSLPQIRVLEANGIVPIIQSIKSERVAKESRPKDLQDVDTDVMKVTVEITVPTEYFEIAFATVKNDDFPASVCDVQSAEGRLAFSRFFTITPNEDSNDAESSR